MAHGHPAQDSGVAVHPPAKPRLRRGPGTGGPTPTLPTPASGPQQEWSQARPKWKGAGRARSRTDQDSTTGDTRGCVAGQGSRTQRRHAEGRVLVAPTLAPRLPGEILHSGSRPCCGSLIPSWKGQASQLAFRGPRSSHQLLARAANLSKPQAGQRTLHGHGVTSPAETTEVCPDIARRPRG